MKQSRLIARLSACSTVTPQNESILDWVRVVLAARPSRIKPEPFVEPAGPVIRRTHLERCPPRPKTAGFGDDAVLEIVVNVALNVLTNYVNTVAQTEVDFPAARQRKAA